MSKSKLSSECFVVEKRILLSQVTSIVVQFRKMPRVESEKKYLNHGCDMTPVQELASTYARYARSMLFLVIERRDENCEDVAAIFVPSAFHSHYEPHSDLPNRDILWQHASNNLFQHLSKNFLPLTTAIILFRKMFSTLKSSLLCLLSLASAPALTSAFVPATRLSSTSLLKVGLIIAILQSIQITFVSYHFITHFAKSSVVTKSIHPRIGC